MGVFVAVLLTAGSAGAQGTTTETQEVQTPTPPPQAAPAQPQEPVRDPVGDINAGLIRAGDFPGAFQIPDTGNVSFAITGFIKSLAFYDTHAEEREAIFLPALLGRTGRDDQDGGTSLSAELSRVGFDVRAPVADGRVRAYVEFDFSGDLFKWRHGYLTWSGNWGEVVAGKTWSTFMDLQTLPDGLGEPTVSGAIFTRQAMFRYSRSLGTKTRIALAIEDPATSDIVAAAPVKTRTGVPDGIATVSFGGGSAHLQVGGLVRSIEFDPDNAPGASDVGAGIQVSGHVNVGPRDKIYGAVVTGQGLGRYLLGVPPTAGALIIPDPPLVEARRASGGFAGVRHAWNDTCRSSVAWSYATATNIEEEGPLTFANSTFVLSNLLCKANRFMTIGVEWDYGKRENRDGSSLDSNRIMFGMQLF